MTSDQVDVIIVGAGLAGLSAARYLKQKNPTLKIKILEAKTRVGGRTQTLTMRTATGTDQWDVGGQWVGPTQSHVLELLTDLNIDLYDQYTDGLKFSQLGTSAIRTYDTVLPTNGSFLQYSPKEAIDFIRTFTKFESLVKQVPVTNPFYSSFLSKLDDMSVAEFARQYCYSKTLEESADVITRVSFGTRASRMSMLYFIMYAHAGGSLSNLLEAVGTGAQRYRIKGGSQQLSKVMAGELGDGVVQEEGGREVVLLGRAVIKIAQDQAGIAVSFINSMGQDPQLEHVRCSRLIFAAPPQQAAKIVFEPPLPETKHQLFHAFPQGNLLKFIVTYRRTFWKEKGFSGEIAASGLTHTPGQVNPINCTFDATTHHGSPAIVGFFNTEWSEKPMEERKNAVLKDLSRFFGVEALEYVDYLDKNWSEEPYSGGCPVSVLPPGYMEAYTHIREPDRRVHWAGTETATQWIGYMSGAIQSGRRAGAEVLIELQRPLLTPDTESKFSEVEEAKVQLRINELDLEGSVYAANYRPPDPRKDLAYSHSWLGCFTWSNLALVTVCTVAVVFYVKKRKDT